MIKLKTKQKNRELLIKMTVSGNQQISAGELQEFSKKNIRGFYKAKLVRNNQIEYSGPYGISLGSRMQKAISKYDFFFIIEQIVDMTEKIAKSGLYLNNVVLDINNSFVNEVTKEVYFLYAPVQPVTETITVNSFIESLIYAIKPNNSENYDYVSKFMYFLQSLKYFDARKIETYISKQDPSIIQIIKRLTPAESGFITNDKKEYLEHYEKKKDFSNKETENEVADEGTALLDEYADNSDYEATDVLDQTVYSSDYEATDVLDQTAYNPNYEATDVLDQFGQVHDYEETGLLIENDYQDYDENETCLLNESDDNVLREPEIKYATLCRVTTGEMVSVNKPVFRIGKESSYVDFFVASNNAVSRSHADIIRRGQFYYIKDLNSKNKTYVNGQVVPPENETRIQDGDVLKLANEEFIFSI